MVGIILSVSVQSHELTCGCLLRFDIKRWDAYVILSAGKQALHCKVMLEPFYDFAQVKISLNFQHWKLLTSMLMTSQPLRLPRNNMH